MGKTAFVLNIAQNARWITTFRRFSRRDEQGAAGAEALTSEGADAQRPRKGSRTTTTCLDVRKPSHARSDRRHSGDDSLEMRSKARRLRWSTTSEWRGRLPAADAGPTNTESRQQEQPLSAPPLGSRAS
jgi:hypothetical protein